MPAMTVMFRACPEGRENAYTYGGITSLRGGLQYGRNHQSGLACAYRNHSSTDTPSTPAASVTDDAAVGPGTVGMPSPRGSGLPNLLTRVRQASKSSCLPARRRASSALTVASSIIGRPSRTSRPRASVTQPPTHPRPLRCLIPLVREANIDSRG